jgi:hypothetical protein
MPTLSPRRAGGGASTRHEQHGANFYGPARCAPRGRPAGLLVSLPPLAPQLDRQCLGSSARVYWTHSGSGQEECR